MKSNITVGIYTLGCRVNQYESCAIAEQLKKHGFKVSKRGECDYYIINTCAVTAESERKSRQAVRRFATKGKVIVIGCASQLNSDYASIENVVYVCGNRNKLSVVDFLCKDVQDTEINVIELDPAPYENMMLSQKANLFSECRAFIKIEDGCNGKCTYCIIPKCRGTVCSREVSSILTEAESLSREGYKELILTGIEVSAYNKIPLYDLINQVSRIKGIERLRLGSLSPNIINDKFISSIAENPKFMPHVHLSLQSCNDKILSAMKRPYRKQDIFNRVKALRDAIPNCMISADIIVGFPGETEEDFMETVNAVRELRIFHVHSFPYSERNGTEAALMTDSVPMKVRSERNSRLIEACSEIKEEILNSMLDKNFSVLIEKFDQDNAIGHTEEFIEARFECRNAKIGDIVVVKAISHDGSMLICDLCKGE